MSTFVAAALTCSLITSPLTGSVKNISTLNWSSKPPVVSWVTTVELSTGTYKHFTTRRPSVWLGSTVEITGCGKSGMRVIGRMAGRQ